MKNNLNRIFLILVTLCCIVFFYGCTKSEPVQAEQTEAPLPQQTIAEPAVETVSHIIVDPQRDAALDFSGFIEVTEIVPDAILEPRYYSTYNFVGERIDGYDQPVILMTFEAAEALRKVSDEVMTQGYRLKIYDAYRPQCAVDHFKRWAENLQDTRMKEYFYPELDKAVLFDQGYIASRSGHSRGSTVDLTLFDMSTGKDVDMGGTFDYFGERSRHGYSGITQEQQNNRNILLTAMENNGFKRYSGEWWHYTLREEPYPDTYFTFPVRALY